ncbi:DUF262 domain-containing protein [Mucilaginibacter sp. L196]|uniref:DUF262 domain-containing protein n=1 Tax=Mucilaginibacter sp. L196 TaxID=1641870 RepID=UPI00131DCF8A|nr:DUF262 domain-containing protein [Mucilaginibacter sp. L196]
MDNRVYYGQYSLSHWLDLILKENIILPDYQRFFVWNQTKVKTLIDTFQKKQFVPPITIGAFKNAQTNENLILDGQQRLTSILLAYLGLYPDKQYFNNTVERLANENDDEAEDDEQLDDILAWDFRKLTEKGRNKEEIRNKIVEGNYKIVDFEITDDFLKNTFLGFSYLVPHLDDQQEQQKYYSSVFRNINIQGESLLPQESRASLYFLNKNLVPFFDPAFMKDFVIKNFNTITKADFVRFLALLSQYAKDGNSDRVARGYKPKMEKYYEEYIYSMVGETPSPLFKNFNDIFPDGNYSARFGHLNLAIESLGIQKQFGSIIEIDMYLFGLIYSIVFEDRAVDVAARDGLKAALDAQTQIFRSDERHKKAPSAIKYLKERIDASIGIYNNYTYEQA